MSLRTSLLRASRAIEAPLMARGVARPAYAARAAAPVASSSRLGLRMYSDEKKPAAPTPAGPSGQMDEDVKASARTKNAEAVGPFTFKAAALFIVTGVGLYVYFTNEKEKVQKRRQEELANKSVGRPQIGGPFQLTSHDGQPFSEQDLRGKWTLIYFGFTNCPDICPEELDKMSEVVSAVDKIKGPIVTPVFVSVDPARDSVEAVKHYVSEFHPRLVGLTGDYDAVKRVCKSYRVYFSTPPDAKATDDYLVDHSIFFYLMDPLGQFVDAFGKNTTADEVRTKTLEAIGKWEAAGGNKGAGLE
ncbi:Cu-binding protein [Vanrija albida]|uniref:Cu-binding protein n=1 Tax=Vanrija albida TaxID=181172 RepID=A0ABR3QBR7_9TREE